MGLGFVFHCGNIQPKYILVSLTKIIVVFGMELMCTA